MASSMGKLQVSTVNDVKIYNVSSGKSIPQWLTEKKKRALKKDDEYARRIELLQDFEFPTASTKIRVSPNGEYIIASGCYKPQIRVFELAELGMKFDRHTDSEVVDFLCLSEGYEKLALLHCDRTISFHAKFGLYYQTRVPKFGRAMEYHAESCDLLVCGSTSDVYRLNLEQGRFLKPFETEAENNNVIHVNPYHQLIGIGGDNGVVECWDPRTRTRSGSLNFAAAVDAQTYGNTNACEVSALKFHDDGLTMAVGASSGHVALYDLRSSKPLVFKDHQYGFPIKSINFHASGQVLSADTKILKIWDKSTGKMMTSVEPPADINDVCLYRDSGLIMIACEQPRIQNYFIPLLGTAPKWCYFLENLTEELEETNQTQIYEDFKFVTREELSELGLEHLIGTNMLRAYMHGFFVNSKLHAKARAAVQPFEYEEYRKKKIQEKLDESRSNRITLRRKLPKVNTTLAQKLLLTKAADDSKKAEGSVSNPLEDSRFGSLFTNPDFNIDEESREYKLLHPTLNTQKSTKDEFESAFDVVEDSEPEGRGSDESSGESEDMAATKRKMIKREKPTKKTKMFELKDEETFGSALSSNPQRKKAKNKAFGDRVVKETHAHDDAAVASRKEFTYYTKRTRKESDDNGQQRRRSMGSGKKSSAMSKRR